MSGEREKKVDKVPKDLVPSSKRLLLWCRSNRKAGRPTPFTHNHYLKTPTWTFFVFFGPISMTTLTKGNKKKLSSTFLQWQVGRLNKNSDSFSFPFQLRTFNYDYYEHKKWVENLVEVLLQSVNWKRNLAFKYPFPLSIHCQGRERETETSIFLVMKISH